MPAATPFLFEPMLCESAECLPEGRDWRYELKLDGFRATGRKSARSAQLWSRNHKTLPGAFLKWLEASQTCLATRWSTAKSSRSTQPANLPSTCFRANNGEAPNYLLYELKGAGARPDRSTKNAFLPLENAALICYWRGVRENLSIEGESNRCDELPRFFLY